MGFCTKEGLYVSQIYKNDAFIIVKNEEYRFVQHRKGH